MRSEGAFAYTPRRFLSLSRGRYGGRSRGRFVSHGRNTSRFASDGASAYTPRRFLSYSRGRCGGRSRGPCTSEHKSPSHSPLV